MAAKLLHHMVSIYIHVRNESYEHVNICVPSQNMEPWFLSLGFLRPWRNKHFMQKREIKKPVE